MRTYTKEEKQAVIDRVISGEPSAHILADTGMPKSTPLQLVTHLSRGAKRCQQENSGHPQFSFA